MKTYFFMICIIKITSLKISDKKPNRLHSKETGVVQEIESLIKYI